MLVNETPDLQSAAETLYQLNMNDQLRETCERFSYAEAEKNALNRMNADLMQINTELKQSNVDLMQSNAELSQALADKDAEIARLSTLLASQNASNK